MASKFKVILGVVRAPFLILAPVCVLLGVAAAAHVGATIDMLKVSLLVFAALLLHMSVNALNEYVDFKTGLDSLTDRTPFSGGSGTLPDSPELASIALYTGLVTLIVACLIGAYLASSVPGLWVIGGIGIVIVLSYTPWINKSSVLCLIAPGTGFGLLMVFGSYYVFVERIDLGILLLSLMVFFLVNNLLLVNQLPDAEADRQVGRHHVVITKGKAAASKIFLFGVISAYTMLCLAVILAGLPKASLLGGGFALLAIPVAIGVIRNAESTEKLIPYMGMNVLVTIGTPVLTSIGLLVA